MPHRADGWTISDEHPTRVIIRPSSAAVTVTVTHNDRIDRWTLRVTVFQFTTETGITGAQSAPAGPGEGPRWTLVAKADELPVHNREG